MLRHNRIISAKDHASIQMNVAEVDKVTGRFNGQFKTYAICGAVRRMGGSDDSIFRLGGGPSVTWSLGHSIGTQAGLCRLSRPILSVGGLP